MSNNENYYALHGGLSPAEYVEQKILRNPAEMERIGKTVAAIPEDAQSILDVGAGHCVFLRALLDKRALHATAIETSAEKIAYCHGLGVNARLGDASELKSADSSYDIVTACEVIEHLPFGVYEKALCELERVARKWILITVPYKESRPFVKCPYCGSVSNPTYHLRTFRNQDLANLFKSFSLERCQYVGRVPVTAGLLARFRRGPRSRFFLCPACGYRTFPSQLESGVPRPLNFPQRTISMLGEIIPTRPAWALALYRRTTTKTAT